MMFKALSSFSPCNREQPPERSADLDAGRPHLRMLAEAAGFLLHTSPPTAPGYFLGSERMLRTPARRERGKAGKDRKTK
jgi:hypothetical protein